MSTELSTTSTFLPPSYKMPDKSKQFMKFEQGDNVIRFLTSPIAGWVFFNDSNKPVRRKYDQSLPTLGDFSKEELKELKAKKAENGELEGCRHFWIALVWDRKTKSPKILEITQIDILKTILGLNNDADWGSPMNYDVNVNRIGAGKLDTTYTVTPKPHKELDSDIQAVLIELEDSNLLNLDAIWDGGYPFEKYLY
ncbi:hypothetical protein AAIP58_000068 [Flavobacterium psychrophilum]|nr:hypothetical protein [Flavobacterium psychrophilum]